jgi:uncharacterized RDD family membrane protein YckC
LILVEQWLYKSTTNIIVLFSWIPFIAFAPLLYSIILHYKTGQTIGKWVAGVKVLDISETTKLTLQKSIHRDSFYLLVAIVGAGYYGFLLSSSENPQNIISQFSSFSDNPVLWWTLLELITMLTNGKRRALHDHLAKSVVIRSGASG